ncbi:hypothetical protein ACFE04_017997 [Oxalis oulophora]
MYAVGRIGSYLTRGVYTVSGPFQPVGGAIDIIVVQQPDGTFKSSPWYVRFGKYQGVLDTKEKIVNITVNGVEASFHMYLDHKGEAYFLTEADEKQTVLYSSSSAADNDEIDKRPMKSKTTTCDVHMSEEEEEEEEEEGALVTKTSSKRSRILGLVFGRRSIKNRYQDDRLDSLERAQIAADLLDVKWSTNLASNKDYHKMPDNNDLATDAQLNLSVSDDVLRDKPNGSSQLLPETIESCSESADGKTSCIVQTSTLVERLLDQNCEVTSKDVNGFFSASTGLNDNSKCSTSQTLNDPTSGLLGAASQRVGEENESDRVEAFVYCETSESSTVSSDGSSEATCETIVLARGESGEVHVFAETLLSTGKLQCEDTVLEKLDGTKLEMVDSGGFSQHTNYEYKNAVLEEPLGSCSPEVNADSAIGTAKVVSQNFSDIGHVVEAIQNNISSLDSVGDCQNVVGDCVPSKVSSIPSSDEDQFLFSDLDEFKPKKVQSIGSLPPDSSIGNCLPNTKELKKPNNSVQDKPLENSPRVISKSIDIPGHLVARREVGQLGGSLPNMCFLTDDNLDAKGLSHSMDSNVKSSKWTFLSKDEISCDAKISSQPVMEKGNNDEATQNEGDVANPPSVGNASNSGNWSLWPFSSKKSRSQKDAPPGPRDANILESSITKDEGENVAQRPKAVKIKKMVMVKAPTSQQLASLNLKQGRNTIAFNFSTEDQGVDARIFLWKWNTRIVISDVDGTITKSDVLGQFMPLVGMDWSQTGVTHFYSAIEENGYQFLFLSARAITQATLTRQFLVNLKQDGKALPDGPIVISPDGIFPSLYREVIRRAPHEFKIACLEDIKALFPADYSPFYAGFGNRDTDEISYLKVGIPKGKIFIINPRGEVAVNRRVDTKSYPSLHALVHGMFPVTNCAEQEDFNSWNFWKLPPVVNLQLAYPRNMQFEREFHMICTSAAAHGLQELFESADICQ